MRATPTTLLKFPKADFYTIRKLPEGYESSRRSVDHHRRQSRQIIELGIQAGSGERPVRVTRVAFLMGDKIALEVFGRDGLETRRAD